MYTCGSGGGGIYLMALYSVHLWLCGGGVYLISLYSVHLWFWEGGGVYLMALYSVHFWFCGGGGISNVTVYCCLGGGYI